jgi:3-dehydroquinate synthase
MNTMNTRTTKQAATPTTTHGTTHGEAGNGGDARAGEVATLHVALGARSHPIYIGAGVAARLFENVRDLRASGRTVFAVASPALANAQPALFNALRAAGVVIHVLPFNGESAKSAAGLARLWEALANAGVDRSGVVLSTGGGVVGDLAGFAAATYLRGVQHIQFPTTLLAMVDSSVGGKTGVNLAAGKNLAGAFHQPAAVLADTDMLATLPPREFAAGMAEVIKYGLLGDHALYGELLAAGPLRWDHPALPGIIRRCCEIKAGVVAADERETAPENGRALLNLGHTFGHAIEKTAGYGEYLHGEAVSIGLVLAARMSAALGLFDAREIPVLEALLVRNGLPVGLRFPLLLDALLEAMRRDKKNRAGKLRFVLLRGVGQAFTQAVDNPALLREIWLAAGAGTVPVSA